LNETGSLICTKSCRPDDPSISEKVKGIAEGLSIKVLRLEVYSFRLQNGCLLDHSGDRYNCGRRAHS